MHKPKRFLGRITAAAAVAGVLLSLGVASASAAKWSTGYPVVAKGSVTFERSDGAYPPATCKVEETWTASSSKSLAWRCPARTINAYGFVSPGLAGTKPFLMGINTSAGADPWFSGHWHQGSALGEAAFINGTQSEPSHLTLNKQPWGTFIGGPWVHATGKINFTTPTGGLTTIVP